MADHQAYNIEAVCHGQDTFNMFHGQDAFNMFNLRLLFKYYMLISPEIGLHIQIRYN